MKRLCIAFVATGVWLACIEARAQYTTFSEPWTYNPMADVRDTATYSIEFGRDLAVITSEAASTIRQVAADARRGKFAFIRFHGESGKTRDAEAMALFLRRLESIKSGLVKQGMAPLEISEYSPGGQYCTLGNTEPVLVYPSVVIVLF